VTEFNFDGLVGPTHNYSGLAKGNLASMEHRDFVSNPRAAALQGLSKMQAIAKLGVGQAVLPPHERPSVRTLRRLGFTGSDAEVLQKAASTDDQLLRLCSSASAMWAANAATVSPSADTQDGLLHITPANLSSMFHRSIEAPTTLRVFRTLFKDTTHFVVHDPLPSGAQFGDEGAANHTRLRTEAGAAQLFAWGRRIWGEAAAPQRYPARQSYEASAAIARAHNLRSSVPLLWQQSPSGIDGGAFHTDVLAVGNDNVLLLHEQAFVDSEDLITQLKDRLGPSLHVVHTNDVELPLADAVRTYPFNSQLLTKPDGTMTLAAPMEVKDSAAAHRFLCRVMEEVEPINEILYLDVNASMNNGGGPACLRLRVELSAAEKQAVTARVFLDDALHQDLNAWVMRHYRDKLKFSDLSDPKLLTETRTALDELTQLLQLGSIYDFQGAPCH
jgi:succinylarginine dihydrolase